VNSDREVDPQWWRQIGVYAIFDRDRVLPYIGSSCKVGLSLKQHLLRQPFRCYWLKVQTIEHPSRKVLEAIRSM
jgi:hypothetical protein